MDDAAWALLAAALRSGSARTRALGASALRDRVWRFRADAIDTRATELLVALLRSSDPTVRAAAVYALSVLDDDATFAALRERVTDSSPVVRIETIGALTIRSFDHTRLRKRDAGPADRPEAVGVPERSATERVESVLPTIQDRLADVAPMVRLISLQFVTLARQAGVVDTDDCIVAIRPRLEDADPIIRRAALELCVRCWKDGSLSANRLAGFVVGRSGDPVTSIRKRAFTLTERLVETDTELVEMVAPAVVGRLADEDRGIRREALTLLRTFWQDGHVRSRHISPAVSERAETDSSPEIRATAVRLLGSLDPPDVVSDLADALRDPDGTVRWRAAQALSARQHCWDDDAVIEGLTAAARAAGETNGGVGTMLAETADDRSVTGLLALTRDPEGTTRGTAVRALGDVPAAHVTERLVECTTDPHRQVRADAIRGLSGRRDERLPDLLVDALDDDEQTVRAVAAGALDRYTHRQTVRDRLQTVIEDDSTAHTVRKSAARSHPDYSPGDADPLSSKLFWQGVVALLYPLLGLYVVVAGWRRDGTREAITATIDWFVGLKPLGYLLGHALYWAIGLLLGGGV